MAAAVVGSPAAPRPRSVIGPSRAPRAAIFSVSAAVSARGTAVLPEYRGLKVSVHPPRIASIARAVAVKSVRRAATVCEAQDIATDVPDVTKATWRSLVMECSRPVLVEFWAPWCGPCRVIHPVIANLSKAYEGKLDCLKLNTDENPDIATQYGIRSIPTIMIFKNGEKKDAIIGAVPESTLVTCIEKFLGR